jgi:hypothetical protein
LLKGDIHSGDDDSEDNDNVEEQDDEVDERLNGGDSGGDNVGDFIIFINVSFSSCNSISLFILYNSISFCKSIFLLIISCRFFKSKL